MPKGLDWDLWLGPAPERPFNEVYFPGPKWYRWWDFGNGTMSDLGSHWNDLPFWALKLQAPADHRGLRPPAAPRDRPGLDARRLRIRPARRHAAGQAPLVPGRGEARAVARAAPSPKWDRRHPVRSAPRGCSWPTTASTSCCPRRTSATSSGPQPFIPKSLGHYAEWIHACKTGSPTTCNFEYAGWLTEANHLGNVAYRAGKKLEWDPAKLQATNAPEADPFIRREYRKGWTLA